MIEYSHNMKIEGLESNLAIFLKGDKLSFQVFNEVSSKTFQANEAETRAIMHFIRSYAKL